MARNENEIKAEAEQAADNMKKIAEEVLRFYESQIDTVSTMIDNTHQILEDFKTNRADTNRQLQDTLAKEKSLRKKDFDNILNEILPLQQDREDHIKKSLDDYLKEQKKVAEAIKRKLTSNEKIRIDEFRQVLRDIQTDRSARENDVRNMLSDFQNEYRRMSDSLRNLLNHHTTIRIRDVRNMMKDFSREGSERKAEVVERARQWRETAKALYHERNERKKQQMNQN